MISANAFESRPMGNPLRFRSWGWAALIVVVFMAFSPTFSNGFINFDDPEHLVDNPHYRTLDVASLRWMWTTYRMGHYQPLSWMSLALDHWLWCGGDPALPPSARGHHATNLVLHVVNTLLVALLALRLLTHEPPTVAQGAALLAAGLFALHPQRVESVAWATERRDVLSTCFLLLTVLSYCAAVHHPARDRTRWLLVSLACYAASLLSKAWGITLPVSLLILDALVLRRFQSPAGWSLRWNILAEKLPFVVLALPIAIWARAAQQAEGALASWQHLPLLSRLPTIVYALAWYPLRTFWPFQLHAIYLLPGRVEWTEPRYTAAAMVLVAMFVAAWWYHKRTPQILAALLVYLVTISPVVGLTQSGMQWVADRYSYVALIPGWILLGVGVARVLYAWPPARARWGVGLCGAVLLTLAALTWQQTQFWKDSPALWQHTLRWDPQNSLALMNLAYHYDQQGDVPRALELYRASEAAAALLGYGTFAAESARYQGVLLEKLKQPAAALVAYQQALQHGDAPAAAEIARLQQAAGQGADTIPLLQQIVTQRPDDAASRLALVRLLLEAKQFAEALPQADALASLQPHDAETHYHRALVLAGLKQWPAARAAYERCVELNPRHVAGLNNLGSLLYVLQQDAAAAERFRQVIAIDATHAAAHYNLGNALAAMGQREPALQAWQQALKLAPAGGSLSAAISKKLATASRPQ